MRRTRFQRSILWALVAAWLGVPTSGTQAGSMTRECALRDAQVLIQVEARESAGATQDTADAMFMLIQARNMCREGHVREALALYDGIVLGSASQHGGPSRRPR